MESWRGKGSLRSLCRQLSQPSLAVHPAVLTTLRSICSGSEWQLALRVIRKLKWWKERRDLCCWMRFCGFAWFGTLSRHKAKIKNKLQSLHYGRYLICFLNVKNFHTLGILQKWPSLPCIWLRHILSMESWSSSHQEVEFVLPHLKYGRGHVTRFGQGDRQIHSRQRLALEALLSFTGVGTLRLPCQGAPAGLLKDERIWGANLRYPGIQVPVSHLPIARRTGETVLGQPASSPASSGQRPHMPSKAQQRQPGGEPPFQFPELRAT